MEGSSSPDIPVKSGTEDSSITTKTLPDEVGEEALDTRNVFNPAVPERIIFCIDGTSFQVPDKASLVRRLHAMIANYIQAKKNMDKLTPEVEAFVIANNKMEHFKLDSRHNLSTMTLVLLNLTSEEAEAMDMSQIFLKLATSIELPNKNVHDLQDGVPPPYVYHIIFLYGRSKFVPVMPLTNPFDYLMHTKFLALDIIYIFNKAAIKQKVEKIQKALMLLNENKMGYFFSCDVNDSNEIAFTLYKCLGHPLIRPSQAQANFNNFAFPLK